jgi:aspartate/methionine/tyrosine aminotransferase
MYYPFFRAVAATGTKSVYWELDEENGYRFDIDLANEMVTDRTRLVFVCNPHNPTGRVMTKEELKGIADLVVDHDLILMVDELWEDIIYDGRKNTSLASFDSDVSERTITSYGFSKTYGVAGLQVGYLVATNRGMMKRIREIGAEVLRGTSTLSMTAARALLSDEVTYYKSALMEHLHEMRTLSMRYLKEMGGVTCNKLEGTFLLFPNLKSYGLTSSDMTEHLLKKGRVAVSDGSLFGSKGEGHIRVNIATSREILLEAFDRIGRALSAI